MAGRGFVGQVTVEGVLSGLKLPGENCYGEGYGG